MAAKEKYYEEVKISDVIRRVGKKFELTTESTELQNESSLLTKQYSTITEKYTAVRRELKYQFESFIQRKKAEELESNSNFINAKDAIYEKHSSAILDIRTKNATALSEAHKLALQKLDTKNALERKHVEIQHAIFLSKEIKPIESELTKLNDSNKELYLQKRSANDQLSLLQQQWEIEEQNAVSNFNSSQEKQQLLIQEIIKELGVLEVKLKGLSNSLHAWLSDNLKGWEGNIGKVCSEQVLLLENLRPTFLGNKSSDTIYGLQIDLSEIDIKPRTLEDYKKEKKAKEARLSQEQTILTNLQETHVQNLDKV